MDVKINVYAVCKNGLELKIRNNVTLLDVSKNIENYNKMLNNGCSLLIKTEKESGWKKIKKLLDTNKDSFISLKEFLDSEEITLDIEKKREGLYKGIKTIKTLTDFFYVLYIENKLFRNTTCISTLPIYVFNTLLDKTQKLPNYAVGTNYEFNAKRRKYTDIYYNAYLFNVPLLNSKTTNKEPIILWSCNFIDLINSCNDKRFILLPLTLSEYNPEIYFTKSKVSHANMLIIDLLNKIIFSVSVNFK